MIIRNFTKTNYHPKYTINLDNFVSDWISFDIDQQNKLLLKWDKQNETFSVWNFERQKLWELKESICYAKFDPRNEWIWLVRRENEELVSIFVYDYTGKQLASTQMEDVIYDSSFIITLLPEKTSVAIDFCGGQDGSQEYFLSVKANKIEIQREIESNACFLFAFDNNTKALLLNFYEDTIFIVSYPDLKTLKTFTFPEDFSYGGISKITDKCWIVSNEYSARHFLFNPETMEFGEEIIIEGYEPEENEDGEILSDIASMEYHDGTLIFSYFKITKTGEEQWWGQTTINL
ncbi:hypothetical protein CGC48_06840 [Capnocytophaga cynodegmi]|uniref:Uncharacterized protein n=1 Tax=Capnocytophaga cynodegmi TaxID=28189 RepID=A0A250E9I2_9FLAO|nr:hypothetical protein [Capnocytophaga cynodegmi]ATA68366.1 hypothetical protein CGC48_06840 [Capnocytophaga cynodegmi]